MKGYGSVSQCNLESTHCVLLVSYPIAVHFGCAFLQRFMFLHCSSEKNEEKWRQENQGVNRKCDSVGSFFPGSVSPVLGKKSALFIYKSIL